MVIANSGRFAFSRHESGRFGIGDPFEKYQANGFVPKVITDFRNRNYRSKNGRANTTVDMLTISRAGLATMVDSDGKLKWAPHNLFPFSETLDNAGIRTNIQGTPTLDVDGFWAFVPNNVNSIHGIQGGTAPANTRVTVTVDIKKGFPEQTIFIGADSVGTTRIDLLTLQITNTGVTGSVVDFGAFVRFTGVMDTGGADRAPFVRFRANGPWIGDGVTQMGAIRCFHLYRSDLGGMVNNPETGNSYVPTTSAAVFLGRIGHHRWNGSAWVNKGMLIESEARTNLCLWSNDFANAVWSNGQALVTPNAAVGLDGLMSASRLEVHTLLGNDRRVQLYTAPSGTHVFSVYLATGNVNSASLLVYNNTTAQSISSVAFTISTGTPAGNGLFRHHITANTGFTAGDSLAVYIYVGTGPRQLGDFIFATQAQIELGYLPSSPIPTTSAAVTRAAETTIIPAANMAYSATAMSFAIEGEMDYADLNNNPAVTPVRWVLNGDNYIQQFMESASGSGRYFVSHSALNDPKFVGSLVNGLTPGINVSFCGASRHLSNLVNLAHMGVLSTANTTVLGIPDLSATSLQLGPLVGNSVFMGTIACFRQWDVDIGDAGITAASLPLAA